MSKLRIEIEMENAAFGEDANGEVRWILQSQVLDGLEVTEPKRLRDVNGNTVGRMELVGEEAPSEQKLVVYVVTDAKLDRCSAYRKPEDAVRAAQGPAEAMSVTALARSLTARGSVQVGDSGYVEEVVVES